MAWARIDDKFFLNPKVVVLDKDAKLLYLAGLTYCAGGLTDGQIPAAALPLLGSMAGIANAQASANRLLDVCLWANAEDGYFVHDYLEYNPSREKVTAIQYARRTAGARGGKASLGKQRQGNKQMLESLLEQTAQQTAQQTPSTNPSHPLISSLTEKSAAAAPPIPIEESPRRKQGSVKAARIAIVAEAFKARDIKFPRLTDQDAKALGNLLDAGYSPETLAECWRDFKAKLYRPDDTFAAGQLSFQFLSAYNRIGNWQDWVELGRQSETSQPSKARERDFVMRGPPGLEETQQMIASYGIRQ